MKKQILLTFLALLYFVNLSYSQFSARVGANFSNVALSFDDEPEPKNKIGFHFGLMADFGINSKLSFRPGLLFSQRGFKITEDGESGNAHFNYLDIPLSFTYAFESKDKGFFIEAGPNIQYLLSAKIKAGGQSEDFKEALEDLDFGILAGIGYKIDQNLGLGINYNLGLQNIAKNVDEDETVNNRNISFYLSYAF
ncbi:MAG: PorT family protein [Saprospiraceae bacterium]|nr:PorT family protein [Saprospiraceae bacterium]